MMNYNQMRKWWTKPASKRRGVNRRDLVVNNSGLKGDHLNHMNINKGILTGQRGGGSSLTFSRKSAQLTSSRKCLYITVRSMENK